MKKKLINFLDMLLDKIPTPKSPTVKCKCGKEITPEACGTRDDVPLCVDCVMEDVKK